MNHGLRTPGEEIIFTLRPKIKSQSQTFRYGQSIFCLPHRPLISDFFDFCLHSVSVVGGMNDNKGRVITEGIFNLVPKQVTAPKLYFLGSKSEGQRFRSGFWNQIENAF